MEKSLILSNHKCINTMRFRIHLPPWQFNHWTSWERADVLVKDDHKPFATTKETRGKNEPFFFFFYLKPFLILDKEDTPSRMLLGDVPAYQERRSSSCRVEERGKWRAIWWGKKINRSHSFISAVLFQCLERLCRQNHLKFSLHWGWRGKL